MKTKDLISEVLSLPIEVRVQLVETIPKSIQEHQQLLPHLPKSHSENHRGIHGLANPVLNPQTRNRVETHVHFGNYKRSLEGRLFMVGKVILILASFIVFGVNSVYAEKITLAYVDFPPYEFEENGKAHGILIRIVETVFKKGNIPLELKFLPFKRAYEYTRNNEIDGLFNFYKTPNRMEYFDYSESIIKNELVLFVRKGSGIRFDTLEDLKGLKVGLLRGYTYGTNFDKSTLFVKETGNSHESNLKKLAFGRLDVYPCDKLVGIFIAMKKQSDVPTRNTSRTVKNYGRSYRFHKRKTSGCDK